MRFFWFFLLFIFGVVDALACNRWYEAYPPFLASKVKPNVLIIMDNSGSMRLAAYWPKDLSWDKIDTSFDPNTLYYGIFDPEARYSYNSILEYFYKDDNGDWSGNFLNWLTMRRWDILQKVLVGGIVKKYPFGTFLEGLDLSGQKNLKAFKKACKEDCRDYTPYSSNYVYYVGIVGGYFKVYKPGSWWHRYYRIRVKVDYEPEGVIQKTAGSVRYGLMVFNHGSRYERGDSTRDGGRVVLEISDDTTVDDMVSAVRNAFPSTWTPLAETYYEAVRYFQHRRSAYNYTSYGDPIDLRCRKNFVILVTDGESTMDRNLPDTYFSGKVPSVKDSQFSIKEWIGKVEDLEGVSDGAYYKKELSSRGTYYLPGVSFYAHTTDLRDDFEGEQNLTLYVVYTFGKSGSTLLKLSAKYGGFMDMDGDGEPDDGEWDRDGDGLPDTYFEASSGYKLEEALLKAISDILKRASAGSSVATLGGKDTRGTTVTQALFYPEKRFDAYSVDWTGYLYAWWFYNISGAQNIREDSDEDRKLTVLKDRILEWAVDDAGNLEISVYLSAEDGTKKQKYAVYNSFDELKPLWEAGEELAFTSPDDRTIYTTDGSTLIPFTKSNAARLARYFGSLEGTCLSSPEQLISYIRGEDIEGCRSRVIDGDGDTWKLGDIIYSTPAIVKYRDYSVVFVGANDGMLHAFKAGYTKSTRNASQPAVLQNSITDTDTDELGQELWAFIPKNVLPYLRFLADKDYCHMYTVDLTPYIYELDEDGDGEPDRKILIGGMRFGGAAKLLTDEDIEEWSWLALLRVGWGINVQHTTSFSFSNGFSLDTSTGVDVDFYLKFEMRCSYPPGDTCGPDGCVGLSSYFALDVTDPEKPEFLWEFTDQELGFTYSGPAVVKTDPSPGWKGLYAVFASGPQTYRGTTKQNLKLFVVDLKSGELVKKIETSLKKSFGGRLFTDGVDLDEDGTTDMFFLGYSKETKKGGVIMVKTKGEPEDWELEVFKIKQPVVSQVKFSYCFSHPYIYFGSGRWFYKEDDDFKSASLYGIPLNCKGSECSFVDDYSKNACSVDRSVRKAWKIDLEKPEKPFLKERVISDPTVVDDVVIFATVEPNGDPCSFGGRSRVWVLNCATGKGIADDCPNYEIDELKGTLLLQLSGANIQDVKFDWEKGEEVPSILPAEGGRATEWFTGVVPESAPPFIEPYGGVIGELLLWLER